MVLENIRMGSKGVFALLFITVLNSNHLAKVSAATSSGAALSETVNGGTKTGECAYADSHGKQIKISYTESASGEVTITSGSGYSGNGKEELRKCREAAEQAQKEAEKAVEEHMKSITDMNSDIKKQHENLEKTMRDLNAQLQERHSKLQDNLEKQRKELQKQHEKLFTVTFPFPI